MGKGLAGKIRWRVHIRLRALKKRPRRVFGYVMDRLFAWVVGLAVCMIAVVLFPALAPSGMASIIKPSNLDDLLDVNRIGRFLSSAMEQLRQFSFAKLLAFLQGIPADLRRLAGNLVEFAKRWRELLGQLFLLLLHPRRIWENLRGFWERHRAKIKTAATKALGIAISFLLYRLLVRLAPLIGIGVLTVWGINAGLLALQGCISFASSKIAMKFRRVIFRKEEKLLREKGEEVIGGIRRTLDMGAHDDNRKRCP